MRVSLTPVAPRQFHPIAWSTRLDELYVRRNGEPASISRPAGKASTLVLSVGCERGR